MNGVVRETLVVADSARGKGVVRERRDVTMQWGKGSFGGYVMLDNIRGKFFFGR